MTYVDIQEVARDTIEKIGYTDAAFGFDCKTCAVINAIDKQSPDIAQGVDRRMRPATIPPTRTSWTSRGRATRG